MGAYDCDCINNLEYDRRERKQKEQSQSTAGQLNDGTRSTAQSTNLIDRQQAIDAANDWYEGLICGSINGLIKRLNALPTVQPEPSTNCSEIPNSSDTISRQAAVDALDCINGTEEVLRSLPPAQPEHKVRFADKDHVWIDGKQYISLPRFQEAVKEAQPKEGYWIEVAGELECSECHTVFTDLYPDYADSVACPHCGAKMTISTK